MEKAVSILEIKTMWIWKQWNWWFSRQWMGEKHFGFKAC